MSLRVRGEGLALFDSRHSFSSICRLTTPTARVFSPTTRSTCQQSESLEECAHLTRCRQRAASAQASTLASHPSAFFVDGVGWLVPSHSARILPFDTATRTTAGIGDCQLYSHWTSIEGFLQVGDAPDVWQDLWAVSMVAVRGSHRHVS